MRSLFLPTLASLALASVSFAQMCSTTSVGFTPLNDLGAGTYSGFQGGLYPGGANVRPPAHDAAALAQAALVVPLDGSGVASPAGRIVFLSIGMSNTNSEWTQFMPLASADPLKDPHVLVVQGAQGGAAANVVNDPTSPYWSYVDMQVATAGATNAQVQVVWLKEAHSTPTDPFPTEALRLRDDVVTMLQICKTHFPNLRIAYLSSRIYAGYATTMLNPEPYAYEGGFAMKWVIEDQINGVAGLNWDASAGPVDVPLVVWGPYLWADGLTPRSDGLTWQCSEYNPDGTHPNATGALKVANMLLDMCHDDPCAADWYLAPPVAEVSCTGDGLDPLLFVPCPCNNVGSFRHGCANSQDADGGALVRTGATNPDTIVLHASDMPFTATSLYLKGNQSTGGGIPFGDGIRCVDGALIRMGTKTNANGSSQFPEPGDPSVSQRGGTPPGSGMIGHYQTYYRNAASFCTPATFNVTNALRLVW